jgi:DNA-binding NarL/FixJ family response regulator
MNSSNFREKKILLIEDDAQLRNTISDLLEKNGFEVLSLAEGDKAVRVIPIYKPSLILCDISMPNFDGFWVLHESRKIKMAAIIPFVFISSKAERLDIRIGMELGADDYLTKPFTPAELLNAVNARLDKANDYEKIISGATEELQRAMPDDFNKLSPAEKRVITFVALNETSAEIAKKLNISIKTVENHRARIASKLEIRGHLGLVKYCLNNRKIILSQNWSLR